MRRGRYPIMLAAALMAVLPSGAARADVPILHISGKGFGHGVGMAQDGAYWMGRQGASTPQILGQFYPGTAIGKGTGQVRVSLLTTVTGDVDLVFPTSGQVRDSPGQAQSPGFPVAVAAGGIAHVHYDGSAYSVTVTSAQALAPPAGRQALRAAQAPLPTILGPTTTTAPAPPPTTPVSAPGPPSTVPSTTPATGPAGAPAPTTTTTRPPASTVAPPTTGPPAATSTRPLWATGNGANGVVGIGGTARRYRGVIETVGDRNLAGGPDLRLVNQLDVEQYLRGMGEVLDPAWPAAALRTQAIAARTYALRAMAASGEICPDTRCQVYLGQQVEYPAMDKAVADTTGAVLLYGGQLASTVYSANGGGFSATRVEGFGPSEASSDAAYPYLRAAPYPTNDPMPWTVDVGTTDVAARLSYGGTITGAAVSQAGPSGRALAVILTGTAGQMGVSGVQMAAALGLKSTLFTLQLGSAAAAPAPPPAPTALQAPPDDASAINAAAAAPVAPVDAGPDVAGPAKRLNSPKGHRGHGAIGFLGVVALLTVGAGAAWAVWRRGLRGQLG